MTPEREALIVAVARAIGFLPPGARVPTDRLHEAEAALDAIEAHGCRVVPIEPAREMIEAIAPGSYDNCSQLGAALIEQYRTATAASPYAPSSNDPHPWYAGGCDALGPNGTCAECAKIADTKARLSSNDEKEGGR